MIIYNKLFALMAYKGLSKKDLLDITNYPTLKRLQNRKPVSSELIDKLCYVLDCQPGDIMEFVKDDATSKKEDHEDNVIVENSKSKCTKELTDNELLTKFREKYPDCKIIDDYMQRDMLLKNYTIDDMIRLQELIQEKSDN